MADVDIARLDWDAARIAHCRLPAWEVGEYVSMSEPSSVGFSFTTQQRATAEVAGVARETDVPTGHVGLVGEAPVAWLRVREPSEVIEITASPLLRRSVAGELGASHWANLDEVSAGQDVVVWSIAARFRAALRGGAHLDDVERDTLVRLVYKRVLETFLGASPVRRAGSLDAPRLARVTDYIEAHIGEELTIERLAGVAALSPFHFMRSFRAATGVPPHRFVRMRRMERAKDMLLSGIPLKRAATATGYKSRSWFAAAFEDHFGHGPGQIPQRKGAVWG